MRRDEKSRTQPIGARSEQRRPVTGERVIEQFGETEAVAPEPHGPLDVGGDDRGVLDSSHAGASFRSPAGDTQSNSFSSTRASISAKVVPLYGNWVTTLPFGWR